MVKGIGEYSIGNEVWPGLGKLVEEMGELNQVLGKLIGCHGENKHWNMGDMNAKLVEEIGDTLGAIKFFVHKNEIDNQKIQDRKILKFNKFCDWHDNGK